MGVAIRYSERIATAGITPSVGAAGRATTTRWPRPPTASTRPKSYLDPWHNVDQVEDATAEWVDWFNTSRLFEYCGDVPRVELENAHCDRKQPPTEAA